MRRKKVMNATVTKLAVPELRRRTHDQHQQEHQQYGDKTLPTWSVQGTVSRGPSPPKRRAYVSDKLGKDPGHSASAATMDTIALTAIAAETTRVTMVIRPVTRSET